MIQTVNTEIAWPPTLTINHVPRWINCIKMNWGIAIFQYSSTVFLTKFPNYSPKICHQIMTHRLMYTRVSLTFFTFRISFPQFCSNTQQNDLQI